MAEDRLGFSNTLAAAFLVSPFWYPYSSAQLICKENCLLNQPGARKAPEGRSLDKAKGFSSISSDTSPCLTPATCREQQEPERELGDAHLDFEQVSASVQPWLQDMARSEKALTRVGRGTVLASGQSPASEPKNCLHVHQKLTWGFLS